MNRKAFFDAIRTNPFSGALTPDQVDGITRILDEWDRRRLTDIRWLAYILATAFWETSRTMQPVIETRRPSEAQNPSVDTAIARLEASYAAGKLPWVKRAYWRKDAAGMSWLGRGLPQLTHKANYERAEKETGLPFTDNPDLMLEPQPAVTVTFSGMINGWFTGRKLRDYFRDDKADWVNARRIINGVDKAQVVATIAQAFHQALKIAAGRELPPDVDEPDEPEAPSPHNPVPPAPTESKTIWTVIIGILTSLGTAIGTLFEAIKDPKVALIVFSAIIILALLYIGSERWKKMKQAGV